jgi:hypothetical protein
MAIRTEQDGTGRNQVFSLSNQLTNIYAKMSTGPIIGKSGKPRSL